MISFDGHSQLFAQVFPRLATYDSDTVPVGSDFSLSNLWNVAQIGWKSNKAVSFSFPIGRHYWP